MFSNKPNDKVIYCCGCKKKVRALLTTGEGIYPHRSDLWGLVFYKCPKCLNFVGSHKVSKKPLGSIPTYEIKKWRIKIHSELDPLWKIGGVKRSLIYEKLSMKLGYTYHTANINSVEEAKKVIKFLQEFK